MWTYLARSRSLKPVPCRYTLFVFNALICHLYHTGSFKEPEQTDRIKTYTEHVSSGWL